LNKLENGGITLHAQTPEDFLVLNFRQESKKKRLKENRLKRGKRKNSKEIHEATTRERERLG